MAPVTALDGPAQLLGQPATSTLDLGEAPPSEGRGPAVALQGLPDQDRPLPGVGRRDRKREAGARLRPLPGDAAGRSAAGRIDEGRAQDDIERHGAVLRTAGQRGQRQAVPPAERAGEGAEDHVVAVGDVEQGQPAPLREVGRGGKQRLGLERRVRLQGTGRQGPPAARVGFRDLPQPHASHVHLRPRWSVLASLVAVCALVLAGMVSPAGREAGAAASIATFRPVVVQSRTIAIHGRAVDDALKGPATVRARFRHPTRPGTLLVAAVIDGVRGSGMPQPRWRIAGWRRGAGMIGGQLATTGRQSTGGLQSVILFEPDNPGGIQSVDVGTVPKGTVTWVTIVLAELAGVPEQLHVVARGGSTNGPRPSDYTHASSIYTAAPVRSIPDLVLTSFTNGGTAPHGERFVYPRGWRVLGADRERNGVDQPVLFDERVWRSDTKPTEWMRYLGGLPIDNCAAIVALG